jgi:ribonuclease R
VHITELGGEYYRYDEARQELRGERSGVRYSTGSRVRVQVSRVDLDGRKIDFRLVREGEEELGSARGKRERVADKTGSVSDELAAVQLADRATKAATKAKARGAAGAPHPVRAAKSASRKPSSARPAGKASKRR